MEEPESPYQPPGAAPAFRSGAGVVSSIRMENFMCHSSLRIEFGDHVNFITGQNGSGKSAILTALCVAFGSRAKGTQRASTLKEFIKTGCSHAVVQVELKNDGEDAFKPEIFGNLITIERRITQTNSPTVLKDCRGKRVENKKGGKDGLRELVEHYNIDVENPCVIMSQDKSREFLHSGNDKEKFKFFFKATLLQQVNDLLQNIRNQLDAANATVDSLESSIKPIVSELEKLSAKIKNMEHMEEISQQVQQLKKKLAWAWVYDVDQQIQEQSAKLAKLKDRVPTCQEKIDRLTAKVASLKEQLLERRQQIASMMEKTSEVKRMKEELCNAVSQATKEEHEINEEHRRGTILLQKLQVRYNTLEQKVHELEAQHVQNTQAEESAIEEQRRSLQNQIDAANETLGRLKGEENELCEELSAVAAVISQLAAEINENDKKCADIRTRIRDLNQRRVNKVTAFGGEKVTSLLRCIERHHRQFRSPPIGPIGAHLALINGDRWALAVEHAIGKLFNTFIVTDHADMRTLRKCSKEANYQHLNIVIYDFSKSRLHIPNHMLPSTNHPTVLSVIQSDNPTVLNVLIDLGSAERQVLVSDYDTGKSVVFGQKVPNLKEAYTMDGHKMFFRGSVQTVLPPNKKIRSERLCSSVEDQIRKFEMYLSNATETLNQCQSKKRHAEEAHRTLLNKAQLLKKRCQYADKEIMEKHMNLKDLDLSNITTDRMDTGYVDDLNEDIKKVANEIQEQEIYLEKMQSRKTQARGKAERIEISFDNLCESAKVELQDFEEAEKKLLSVEDEICSAEEEKSYYENIMENKVLLDIEGAEANYKRLKQDRLESCKKASIICPESEVEALGGCGNRTPDQLSAQLSRLSQRLQSEARRHTESIDDLREMYDQKERKIKRKRIMYDTFREKLSACQKALDLRWTKFQRNATLLKRQLTWQFNGHLRKKGISGHVKVNYEDKTLSIEVKMPQDATNSAVRDTRGLSGGERSFSTLCFAMALHEMTEAPFRAMDEFDVFMDAISRKISLDTLVDFSVSQGSQWIFITPHDISMVKSGERIKKQQMAAPRGS